jgi:hypothetical protein
LVESEHELSEVFTILDINLETAKHLHPTHAITIEHCGDGIDNNGNRKIDENCS